MKENRTFDKGRWVKVGVAYEMYGYVSVPLPDDIDDNDEEGIEEYLNEHIDEVDLPCNAEYLDESLEFDMDSYEVKAPPEKEE